MSDELLWKREPWRIVKTGNGRIRVDNGMQSDWPVLNMANTKILWGNFYKVPKDVRIKVKAILIKREVG